jgi:beta-xylosidase
MFKRHGYYYVSFPEGGVSTGGQIVIRSKDIYGPYERKQGLPDGSPHQGGMVELDNGQGWFISFKSAGFLGRIDYLNPVTWGADDWPVFGDNGKSVDQWKKPDVGAVYPIERSQVNDEFDSDKLALVWQWNHNPVNEHWSLSERPGWLRLNGNPAISLPTAANTLTQKLWDNTGTIDVKLDASRVLGFAGITFISGSTFDWVGVGYSDNKRHVAWESNPDAGPELPAAEIYLRAVYNGATARLLYSFDGKSYVDTEQKITLKFLNWKGARIGLFCRGFLNGAGAGRNGSAGGDADFDYFHYQYGDNSTRK